MIKITNLLKWGIILGFILLFEMAVEPYSLKITSYNIKNPQLSGLGTSILPLRFNNRPEIVAVEFEQ